MFKNFPRNFPISEFTKINFVVLELCAYAQKAGHTDSDLNRPLAATQHRKMWCGLDQRGLGYGPVAVFFKEILNFEFHNRRKFFVYLNTYLILKGNFIMRYLLL
jgi:hypothetical protein